MRRRPAVLALATVALVSSVAFVVAACAPTPATLSDPREILAAAVTNLRAARTVHLDAAVDGSLPIGGLFGGPQASGRGLGLTGTHLEGDVDLAGQRAALRFQVPALLGLEGEVRQISGEAYLESSLTSRGWHRITGSDLPVAVGRPTEWLAALAAWLDRPTAIPVRLDDGPCRSGTCYVVRLTTGVGDIDALASAVPELAAGLAGRTPTLELRIDRTSLVLSEAIVHVDLGPNDAMTVSATFTAWNAAVTVAPPPPGEIVSGPLLP
jgi:hypothetical protein